MLHQGTAQWRRLAARAQRSHLVADEVMQTDGKWREAAHSVAEVQREPAAAQQQALLLRRLRGRRDRWLLKLVDEVELELDRRELR